MLKKLQAYTRGDIPPAPVAQLIGFQVVSVSAGQARCEMDTGPRHANPMGTLHGGIICDLTDAAMGIAFASTLEEGESFTTLELKTNFLKPIWSAHLVANGRVVKRGRMVGLVECDVTDQSGSLVARSSSTCLVLRGDAAGGR